MKEECKGCIMTQHKCILVVGEIQELIPSCPCLKCLVKITCSYDDICPPYSRHMDQLYANPKYAERIERYETKYNTAHTAHPV